MNSRVLFSSACDDWETPELLRMALYKEFKLNFDPCPLGGTVNGLSSLFCRWAGKRVYVNPPYGPGIAAWIERGFEADIAVYLLPARTDVRWFHRLCLPYAQEIRFLKGRLKFSGHEHGAPFPSMVVVFPEGEQQGRLFPWQTVRTR